MQNCKIKCVRSLGSKWVKSGVVYPVDENGCFIDSTGFKVSIKNYKSVKELNGVAIAKFELVEEE